MAPLANLSLNDGANSPSLGSVEPAAEIDWLVNPYACADKSLQKKKGKLEIRQAKLVALRDSFVKDPTKLDGSQREAIQRIDDVCLQIAYIEKLQQELAENLQDYERALKQSKLGSKKKEADTQKDLISRFLEYRRLLVILCDGNLGKILVADAVATEKEMSGFLALHDLFATTGADLPEKIYSVLAGTRGEVVPGMTGYYAKKLLTRIATSETYGKYAGKVVEEQKHENGNNADPKAEVDSPLPQTHKEESSHSELVPQENVTAKASQRTDSSTWSNDGSGQESSIPHSSVLNGSPVEDCAPTAEVSEPLSAEKEKKRRPRNKRAKKTNAEKPSADTLKADELATNDVLLRSQSENDVEKHAAKRNDRPRRPRGNDNNRSHRVEGEEQSQSARTSAQMKKTTEAFDVNGNATTATKDSALKRRPERRRINKSSPTDSSGAGYTKPANNNNNTRQPRGLPKKTFREGYADDRRSERNGTTSEQKLGFNFRENAN